MLNATRRVIAVPKTEEKAAAKPSILSIIIYNTPKNLKETKFLFKKTALRIHELKMRQ